MLSVEVFRRSDSSPSDGGGWRPALEDESAQLGEFRVAPGTAGEWHTHGQRTLFGFVVSGQLDIEYGPRGSQRTVVRPGEFVRIAPGVVHRDVNTTRDSCVILVLNVGPGPASAEATRP